jgi:hypothetical protein
MRSFVRRNAAMVGLVTLVAVAVGGGAAASQGADGLRFQNDLVGTEEVPVADVDGQGTSVVRIDTDSGEVCFDFKFRDTGTPNRAHIHSGSAGTNGPIVVTFFELRIPPADPGAPATDPRNDDLEDGKFSDCVTVDPTLADDIASNPTSYYVNLHNARFPGGAIRCQLKDA